MTRLTVVVTLTLVGCAHQQQIGPPIAAAPSAPLRRTWLPVDHLSEERLLAYQSEPDSIIPSTDSDNVFPTLKDDLQDFPGDLWEGTKSLVNWRNALVLTVGGLASYGISGDVDDKIEAHYEGGDRLRGWEEGGNVVGSPITQFSLAGLWYVWGRGSKDPETLTVGKTLIDAQLLNGAATLALKGITQRGRPEHGSLSFPSAHTSGSFTTASVLHHYYGWKAGIPAYAAASFVGLSRIADERHFASDVLFGAVMGLVIGHSVANEFEPKILGMHVIPYQDPQYGGMGVALFKEY